jgi:AcrR family transcriptional regulator
MAATTRSRNPRGQGERLRQELLVAAVGLMAEHRSLAAVTLRGVAAAAGVSPTAVYRHFSDRDDLLRQAIAWCWARFDEAIEVPTSGDPEADFRAQGRAYLRFALEEPGVYRVLFSHRERIGSQPDHPGLAVFAKLVERVAGLLTRLGDERDPWFVAVQVHTWIHGIADLRGSHGDMPWPPVDLLVDDLALRLGLTAVPGPRPARSS